MNTRVGEEWDDVSNEAKDLINKMLTKPKIRLTAEGALKHTWIKTLAGGSGQILSVNNRKMLKSFTASQKLKKAVLTYIATQCTEKEVNILIKKEELIGGRIKILIYFS